jgi:hypothetical protein
MVRKKEFTDKVNEQVKDVRSVFEGKWWFWIVGLIVLIFMATKVVMIGALILMLGIAVLVSLHKMAIPFTTGVELVSFFSICIAFAVSPWLGALFGLLAILIIHFLYNDFSEWMGAKYVAYGGLCLFVPLFAGSGVIAAGIVLALVRAGIFVVAIFFLDPERLLAESVAMGVNFLLTIVLFVLMGNWLVGVLM